MIQDVDESLRALVRRDALPDAGIELSFEAPTKDWASRRSVPTVNLYLYDVREDVERREVQPEVVRDATGRVVGRRPPARRYKLSYLVSVWTQRPEDEHRLLSSLLACFLRAEVLDQEVLAPSLADQPQHVFVHVAHPPPKERALADVWSALGGEMRAALDLVVDTPFDAQRVHDAGPPVLEPLELRVRTRRKPFVPPPAPPVPAGAQPVASEPEVAAAPAPEPEPEPTFEVVRRRRWWRA